jgi:ribonuclease M5
MQRSKLKLSYPVVVEGKYDKIRVANVVSSPIIVLNGFSAFNSAETISLLKASGKEGLILLTDPDNAGTFIRGKLKTLLGNIRIINVYAPAVVGSDSRRNHVCKEGVLGVESTDEDTLYNLLLPYSLPENNEKAAFLTPARAYADKLTGSAGSAALRASLCAVLGIPKNISAKALMEYINENLTEPEYISALENAAGENDL